MNSTIGDGKKEDLKTRALLEMQEPTEGLIGELDLFFDDLVKSQNWDGKVKSSIYKARKT